MADANTPNPPEDTPAPAGPSALPITDRVSAVWRFVASAAGVVATIGGVIGVYQFFATPSQDDTGPGTASDMIVAMVDQKVISLEEASRIAIALSGTDDETGPDAAEAIQDIVENGSDQQRRAIQMLAERRTRQEGLELLEAEAKTADDWQAVAQFAANTDAELALSAIRKSIALEPENLQALTTMARLQSDTGDYAGARRSAASATLLARTPLETILAAQSTLFIFVQAGDIPAIQEHMPTIIEAADDYDATIDSEDLPDRVPLGTYRKQPLWISSRTRHLIAYAYTYLDRNAATQAILQNGTAAGLNQLDEIQNVQTHADSAIAQAELAVAGYEKLMPVIDMEDRYFLVQDNLATHSALSFAYFSKGEPETAVDYSARMLDLVRTEAETGSRAAIEALPKYYESHATYLYQIGDYDRVLETVRKSTDLQITYARRYEEEDLDLKIAALEHDYEIKAVPLGKGENIDAAADTYFSKLEALIRQDPEDEKGHMNQYVMAAREMSGLYSTDRYSLLSRDKALATMERPTRFNQEMTDQHGENHDRIHFDFFLTMRRGDIHSSLSETDNAFEAYQDAYELARTIPPVEDEPNIVELSQLEALYRIGLLNTEASEQAILEGIALGQQMDTAGHLSTGHQNFYNQLKDMARIRNIDQTAAP